MVAIGDFLGNTVLMVAFCQSVIISGSVIGVSIEVRTASHRILCPVKSDPGAAQDDPPDVPPHHIFIPLNTQPLFSSLSTVAELLPLALSTSANSS